MSQGRMRVFALLWLCQAVSMIGSGITAFALGVYVYKRTGSIQDFTLIELVSLGPAALISPVAGAITDRFRKRSVLILCDLLSCAALAVLALCLHTGDAPLWQIGLCAAIISVSSSFQWPAFSSLVTILVPKDQLGRAAGATELARGLAQIFSPVLAGIAAVHWSIDRLLYIDSATYLFSALVFTALRGVTLVEDEARAAGRAAGLAEGEAAAAAPLTVASLLADIREGWRYLAERRELALLLSFVAFTNIALGIVEICITPLVLGFASPTSLGVVLLIGGLGMLIGGVLMSSWSGARRPVRLVIAVTAVQGALLLVVGKSPTVPMFAALAFFYLFCFAVSMATNHAMWLRVVPAGRQGAVLGLRRLVESAALPIAALVAGPLAERVFQPWQAGGGAVVEWLASTGKGDGYGVAFMYSFLGLLTLVVSAFAWRKARLFETDLFAKDPAMAASPSDSAAVAPSSPQERRAAHLSWALWLAFFAAVVALAQRPWRASEVPAAASVPAGEFSARRAWSHLEMLASTIGNRVTGSENLTRAADYLEGELRRLSVETARQRGSGSGEIAGVTYVYRGIDNVLARIPGKSPAAILVAAHFDSAAEGAGAADNAMNVAAALELVRAVAAGPPLPNTLVFNFNGGEELGLLGAKAFAEHPWAKDVAAFLNLDASGGQGRQLLLRSTLESDALFEAYASAAPHLHGTILAQEIFSLLPFDTDYTVYSAAGLRGLDFAPYGDNYAYHSALDGLERVSPRTLQEIGENLLATVRAAELAAPRAPIAAGASSFVYYDVLGLGMVRYSSGAGLLLAALVGLGALALAFVLGRGPRTGGQAAMGAVTIAVSLIFALLVPIIGSIVAGALGATMAWFARPWLACALYGSFSVAGVALAQAILRRFARGKRFTVAELADSVRRGLLVVWALLLLLCALLGAGSSYLPLWWCLGNAVALVAAARTRGPLRWLLPLAGLAPAALLTVQAAQLLLTSLIPLTGMLGPDMPVEQLIAAVTAIVVFPLALQLAPLLQATPNLRAVSFAVGAAVLAALVLAVLSFPYTAERPKRAYVDLAYAEAAGKLSLTAIDPGPPLPDHHASLPPLPPSAPAPHIAIEPGAPTGAGSTAASRVRARLHASGAFRVEVSIEGAASWSAAAGEPTFTAPAFVWIGSAAPLELHITKDPKASAARLVVKAHYLGGLAPELAPLIAKARAALPSWTVAAVETVREISSPL